MKLGYAFYPFKHLKTNQKCSVSLKKPQNSGKFARILILHSNDCLTPVHEGYARGGVGQGVEGPGGGWEPGAP